MALSFFGSQDEQPSSQTRWPSWLTHCCGRARCCERPSEPESAGSSMADPDRQHPAQGYQGHLHCQLPVRQDPLPQVLLPLPPHAAEVEATEGEDSDEGEVPLIPRSPGVRDLWELLDCVQEPVHCESPEQRFVLCSEVDLDATTLGSLRQAPECVICQTEFNVDERLCQLPVCGHLFHRRCVRQWLECAATCPICRSTLHEAEVVGPFVTES
mmetsp:Transcript_139896/g.389913  ORF Transcript_139896/g.389913 Transcript_139896/m.389913 type:complete len:213 (+) Transcript_139896:70-708(+)